VKNWQGAHAANSSPRSIRAHVLDLQPRDVRRQGSAIINPPEAGIIAVGAVEEKVVAENGQIVVRPRLRLTMSCDHRVVDGATGAKFLRTVRDFLEEPVMILA
jgi:pyruvate/2-oxoglutarate dehydrogenase complex dihydrolipoamide acyltransferase (E2) component